MQVKLLRAIQEKRIRKVGAVTEEAVDVRIVSATHQNLAQCVAQGRFRQDLFYRLNVIELRMPALRERQEDVGILADAILQRLAQRSGLEGVPQLSSMALRYLKSYPFPGNVRELENILERALAFSDGRVINVEDLGLRPIVTIRGWLVRGECFRVRGRWPLRPGVQGRGQRYRYPWVVSTKGRARRRCQPPANPAAGS